MKKIFITIIFFVAFFALKSVFASESFAATVSGNFDNRLGGIDITVNYTIKDQNGSNPVTGSVTVGHGSAANAVYPLSVTLTTGDFPSLTWFTSCNLGSASTTGTGGSYTFVNSQDVHCTTTNSTITITTTSCPFTNGANAPSVSFQVSSAAPNISTIKLFKALSPADPDTDTNPFSINYVNAGTLSWTGAADGAWNVRIKAYPNPVNGNVGVSVANSSFTCGTGYAVPTNLNAYASCVSTSVNLTFNWSAAAPGTFTYQVQTNLNTDPGAGTSDASWTGPPLTPNPATNTYITNTGTFTNGKTYFWRVKASPSPQTTPATYYYSTGSYSFATPIMCSATAVTLPVITKIDTCWNRATTPDRTKARATWTSASATGLSVTQEIVEWSADGTFTDTTMQASGSSPLVVSYATFANDTYYNFRVRDKMSDGNWYASATTKAFIPASCTTNSTILNVTYTTYCVGSAAHIRFYWNSIANDTDNSFEIDGWTFNPITNPTGSYYLIGTSTTNYYDDTTFSFSPNVFEGIIWGRDNANTSYSSSFLTISVDCTSFSNTFPLWPPDHLTASITPPSAPKAGCDASNNPVINFSFWDQSFAETQFLLEVSSEPFTGDYSTNSNNKWAVKVIPSTTSATANDPSRPYNFQWSTASPMTYAIGGAELVPKEGVNYFWRVAASNANGVGAFKYNDGSTAGTLGYPGAFITTAICKNRYDLKATFVPGSWNKQNFIANDTATVNVEVENVASPTNAGDSPATQLYFYYRGGTMPACSPTSGTLSPPVPLDGTQPTGVAKSYDVGVLHAGQKVSISISFNVGTGTGTTSALAYVVPTCSFLSDPNGTDPDFSNNVTPPGFSYTIGINKFFQSTGGDVGAGGTISVGVNSSALVAPNTPTYQSQYLLAAGSVNSPAAAAPGGYTISSYNKGQVISGGIYNYFANRFRAKAMAANPGQCNLTNGQNFPDGLYYCSGDMTISSTSNITIGGNAVFFIDGNLNINTNVSTVDFNLYTTGSAVYIVKGDINIGTRVVNLQGVFIGRKSFGDCISTINNCQVFTIVTSPLIVTGAVYLDGEDGGKLNLQRSDWHVANNGLLPSDKFVFDPKYLVLLSNLLSNSSVGWRETTP